jgi:HK97 family phage major capsid protein
MPDTATLETIQEGVDNVEKSVGDLGGEVTAIKTSVEELKTANEAHEAQIAAINEQRASQGAPGIHGGEGSKHKYAFSLHDMLKHAAKITNGKENTLDCPADAREKIMSTEIGPDGAYTVPPEFAPELIERLKAEQVLVKAGMRTFTVDAGFGAVHLPRLESGMTIGEIGEAGVPAVSTPQVELLVANVKRIAGVVEVPNDLLRMNGVGLEDALRQDFIEDGALRADILGLRGTGASNQPRGIVNTPGIGSVVIGATGGPITIDLLLDLQKDVAGANSMMRRPAYIMHSNVWYNTLQITEDSKHVFPSVFFAPGIQEIPKMEAGLLGHMALKSNQIPTNLEKSTSGQILSEIYFGDWSDFIQVRWGNLELRTSREATHPTTGRSAFHQDLTVFLLIQRLDYVVRHPGSFSVITDVEAN